MTTTTDHQRLTDEQLAEIERLASYFAERVDADLYRLVGEDVPALLALVREQQARIDSAYEAFVDMAQANGGLSRSAEKLTHVSRIMSSLTGHETPQRVAYNRVWAEVERARVDAKNWHDTYQQHASSFDAFLGELLELLPGAEEQGSDAYDQIPRGIEALLAEAKRLQSVQALHSPFGIYNHCNHQHTAGEPGVQHVTDVGLVCSEGFLYAACRHCCTDAEGKQTEECASSHAHSREICPTRTALDGSAA